MQVAKVVDALRPPCRVIVIVIWKFVFTVSICCGDLCSEVITRRCDELLKDPNLGCRGRIHDQDCSVDDGNIKGLMQEPDIVKIRFNFHGILKVMVGILVHDQEVSSMNCSFSGFINSISNLFIFKQNEDRWIVTSSINFIDSMFGDDEFFIMSCDMIYPLLV
ncbi:hypothetical protein ACFX13_015072 [Malus domestica]